ncbi:MAG TPA: molybdopterin oxidoreductase [Treponema sp.]|nr:MAG: molybdopterin oxidoreductase [Treponema sp. GWA1_62_8]OHE70202.1 MAG: molybdopterin oxidoreductase [Treponema sp. GWC1_61_84]OHE71955.1 MAG: molybdopterin oxidoreductase [Treponema sp. RIFOXYC1_FULL_61_9]HCM28417.1 molybdopterin oxidoreductase [Treponema sp.]
MLKEYTCIACPRGCGLEASIEDGKLLTVEGAFCAKGGKFVEQELYSPLRNIATSVLVLNGCCPLASVRLTKPVPKAMIFPVIEEIRRTRLTAPVSAGQVAIADVLGLGCDVIVTRKVPAAS